jgi:translation initiation factor 5B
MMTSSSVYVLFIDDGGYLASVAKAPSDGRQRNQATFFILHFLFQNLNVTLFYENKNPREWISMVPTSAHTGDGMGNLMALLCELTQTMLAKRLSYTDELQATVMEVR